MKPIWKHVEILAKVALHLPWANFWGYILENHFRVVTCFTRASIFLRSASKSPGKLTLSNTRKRHSFTPADSTWLGTTAFLWTSRVLTLSYCLPLGIVNKQQELMGLWTLWEDTTPVPQAAHVWHSQRHWGLTESSLPNSLWRKKCSFPKCFSPRNTAVLWPCPGWRTWAHPCCPSFGTHLETYINPSMAIVLSMHFFLSILTLTPSALLTVKLWFLLSLWSPCAFLLPWNSESCVY